MKSMRHKHNKRLMISLSISMISIITGWLLWDILVPIQDYNTSTEEQLRQAQRDAAINPDLGRFLLIIGFILLGVTVIEYIYRYVQLPRNK